MMNLPIRPRRNRKSANIRGLIRETSLSPEHLIYPVFVHEGTGNQPIPSLPGCTRWSVKGLVEEAKRLMDLGIRTLDLFPAIPDEKKTPDACEACNPDGLIPRTIYALKSEVPGITVMTDVALDPYNSDGHDGLVESAPTERWKSLTTIPWRFSAARHCATRMPGRISSPPAT